MTDTRNIRMLTRYTAWANSRLFSALAELPKSEAAASALGDMVKTLNHAYVVDLIWKAHLEGERHGFTWRNTEVMPSLGELRDAQALIDDWYIDYADRISGTAHDEVVHFEFVDGGSGAMTCGDMVLHVVNHKTYHRGYVAQMLYQASVRPPTMDLPVFLRDVPPVL
ncbi:damage-inducible protein DinB [Variovorax sp. S2]|uniref:DinB family protein n=1 Tax=Variovorax sp. S12S4 TaxID=3029170 RepID=UPI00215BC075|nr:DinB family protein [Variovorax sp. S12S4]MCR8958548.1 damage-inducible protein DinB [Variovorax sp. S12S4]